MNLGILIAYEAWAIALVLFVLMMLFTWLGRKTGNRLRLQGKAHEKPAETSGLTALLFFLLAFTFGMSGSRFDDRRKIVVEEANDIGTALLRADLYPDSIRMLFREDFEAYVEARVDYYEAGPSLEKILAAQQLTQVVADRLWKRASDLGRDPANLAATQQMIPALNTMIDVTTSRLAGEKAKVPESIILMLFMLALITAFYGGYTSGRKGSIDWLVEIGFCLLVCLVVLFTLDLDRPRRGFVNLDTPNQAILELRNSFK